jgi:DNA repair ATPase RecN
MVAELAQRDLRYNNARERMGLGFQSLAALAGQGGQPFTERTLDQIDDQIARLEPLANQYEEQVQALNRYYEALGEYVAMLHEVNAALVTVTASARAPQAVTISPAALSQQATEIRDQAREIQSLLDT